MLGLDDTCLTQHVRGNGRLTQRSKRCEIHNRVLLAEYIGKSALGHAPVQRHLAAFKTAQDSRTTARALPLVAPGRRLAHSRSHATPHPLPLLRRFSWRSNVR